MIKQVLIDTGIWIDYLHGENSVSSLKFLLEENIACTHVLIEGELRAGNFKNREIFFNSITKLKYIPLIDYPIIFKLIEKEKLYGKGLSFIDISLYAAVKAEQIKIWTKDLNLSEICRKENLLYKVPNI